MTEGSLMSRSQPGSISVDVLETRLDAMEQRLKDHIVKVEADSISRRTPWYQYPAIFMMFGTPLASVMFYTFDAISTERERVSALKTEIIVTDKFRQREIDAFDDRLSDIETAIAPLKRGGS